MHARGHLGRSRLHYPILAVLELVVVVVENGIPVII